MGKRWSDRLEAADATALALLALAGWSLWVWAESRGDGEAWDQDVFWSVALPGMALTSVLAGLIRPRVARFAGLTLVVPQAITLFATSGFGPLAIVGILFFAIIAVVLTGIAIVAAKLGNRFNHRNESTQ